MAEATDDRVRECAARDGVVADAADLGVFAVCVSPSMVSAAAPARDSGVAIATVVGTFVTTWMEPEAERTLRRMDETSTQSLGHIWDSVKLTFGKLRENPFEDLARNLEVPYALGMTTVLVVPPATREVVREGWELEGREALHVDYVTDDLTAFLRSNCWR